MTARSLSKRLHALERRLGPIEEPFTIVVHYVAPGGEIVSTAEYLITHRPRAEQMVEPCRASGVGLRAT